MLGSFSLYVGLLVGFGLFAWLLLRSARVRQLTGDAENAPDRFAAVDGLRGVLALSVFFRHGLNLRSLYANGVWNAQAAEDLGQASVFAVTLFFFITGFVFWTKLQRTPRISLGRHLRSRLLRLVPAYWACLALMILGALTIGWKQDWSQPLDVLNNWSRWLLFTVPGIPSLHGTPLSVQMFTDVVWTLRVEWVFYLLVPFCGWFAAKSWRVLLYLAALYGLGRLLAEVNARGWLSEDMSHLFLQVYPYLLYCLSGGILVAVLRPWLAARISAKIDFRAPAFSLIGLAIIGAVFFLLSPSYGWIESVALLVPFLLIALGNDWFGLLTSAPMRLLGRVSYSIYLLHVIVLAEVFQRLNQVRPIAMMSPVEYWAILASVGCGLITLACVWYRWFERPFFAGNPTMRAERR